MCFLLILIIRTALGYDFRCPVQAEWRLEAHVSCITENKYVCLFNLLTKEYQDDCSGSSQSKKGSKLVFQPVFNLAECNTGKYQPIVFSTHGNSECIFLRSSCNEEGQTIYSNGSFITDIACGCDHSQGYTFVSKPKNSCFCIPSEEDCTCFREKCQTLSADYQCISNGDMIANITCQERYQQISFHQNNQTYQNIQLNTTRYSSAHTVMHIIVVLLVVYVVGAVIGGIASEFKDRKLESMKHERDDVIEQLNREKDDTRQQFIHDLFLKGECAKVHSARVVLIGKNGVGKTSLMRRLLWHHGYDHMFSQSTDGIEIEKCNINIINGKWSQCEEIDDDLTRLIHQVYTEKTLNGKSVDDHGPFGFNTDEPSEFSIDTDSLNGDTSIDSSIHNYDVGIYIHSTNDDSLSFENKEAQETVFSQKQPERINRFDDEYDSDSDERIDQLISTIMKSHLHRKEREHDELLASCWLWDFAGQKDFYATHQVFLSKCAVYLLVTDNLDFSTAERPWIDFEDSAQYASFWFDAIHCYWSTTKRGRLDPPIIIVCTNEDKYKDHLKRQQRQEQFHENLSKVLKKQEKKRHLRSVYFVSNTEDDDDVYEEIRNDISRQAMDMEDWGRKCPLKWLLFQQVLGMLKDSGVPISSTLKLSAIAKHADIGITNDEDFKLCLQYCHENGTVIYFDEENLQDYVILDPKWLVAAFRCLVSDKIENVIKVSDHWQKLIETGELSEKLVTNLFKKEPKLKFLENKPHLLEVMKRFDILVNLRNSTALYMPCMMKSCTFEEVRKRFIDESQTFYRTSWLCLEFQFLPPAFFNHILAWYIKKYSVSVILEKGTCSVRKALFRQIGVFDLDLSRCEQLVICEGPNVIALQVWNSRTSDKTYVDLRTNLCHFVDTLLNRYSLKIELTKSFQCKDGDFTINRQKMHVLRTEEYRCLEHKTNHLSQDLVQPWYDGEQIRNLSTHRQPDTEFDESDESYANVW